MCSNNAPDMQDFFSDYVIEDKIMISYWLKSNCSFLTDNYMETKKYYSNFITYRRSGYFQDTLFLLIS